MNATRPLAGLGLMAVAWWAAGCRTVPLHSAAPPADPVAGAPVAPQPPFARALAHYSQGAIHEMHRDYAGAISNFQRSLELDPGHEDLHFRLSMLLMHQKRNPEAVAVMEQLVGRQPRSSKALRWMALIYRAVGEEARSAETYLRLLRLEPGDTVTLIQLASLYVSMDREEDALRLLQSVIEDQPDSVDLLRALGEIYIRNGTIALAGKEQADRRREALDVFEQIRKAEPQDPFILNKLGELYILDQDVGRAIACFEEIEKIRPDDLGVKQQLANSLLALGNKEKAVEVLENIAREQPANAKVYYYLASLYQQMGNKENARSNFGLAIKAEPEDPAAYLKLSLLELEEKPEEAERVLKKGLKKIPDDPSLLEMLAHVHLSEEAYDEAVERFEQARQAFLKKEPPVINPSFHFNYAIACHEAGNLTRAADLLGKAMEANAAYLDVYSQFALRQGRTNDAASAIAVVEKQKNPDLSQPRVHYWLAVLYNYDKQYPKAVAAYRLAEELALQDPRHADLINPQFYFWFGAACERAGQLDLAEEKFEECIKRQPENAEAYNYLAYMWAEKNIKMDQAMNYVKRALELEPNNGAFIDTLGWIYYMQGHFELALAEVQKAAELIPDDPTITEHLGDIWAKLRKPDKAVDLWKRAFVLDAESATVTGKLAEANVDLEPLRTEAEAFQKQREETARAAEAAAPAETTATHEAQPAGEVPLLPALPALPAE